MDEITKISWDKKDSGWLATLFGTALGAGILYLPVQAAQAGFFSLLFVAIIALPAIWIAHRNLTHFCLSATHSEDDITSTATEKFGVKAGGLLILAYVMSIFPILLLYGIGLTNVVINAFVHMFHLPAPSRLITSFIILLIMTAIVTHGEKLILSVCGLLVVPLACILVLIAIYFIPLWHMPSFGHFTAMEFIKTIVIMTPLLVFSFNHTPACSSFAQTYRLTYKSRELYNSKIKSVLNANILLLMVIILPFVFSCVLAMTDMDIINAIKDNIPAILAISNGGHDMTWAPYAITFITFLAITSSFFGVYIGSLEGCNGLTTYIMKHACKQDSFNFNHHKTLQHLIRAVIFLLCWLTATLNFSVINIILTIVAPVLAIILFIMPVYSFYRVKELKGYRCIPRDIFVLVFGLVVIAGFIIPLFIS